MRRGEIWWADLPAPIGRRPVLILSRDSLNEVRASVTVALITRTIRDIPTEVRLGPDDGMPIECVCSAGDITTAPKANLLRVITTLRRERLDEVNEAVTFALDLS